VRRRAALRASRRHRRDPGAAGRSGLGVDAARSGLWGEGVGGNWKLNAGEGDGGVEDDRWGRFDQRGLADY
jgi:hypothetical protein